MQMISSNIDRRRSIGSAPLDAEEWMGGMKEAFPDAPAALAVGAGGNERGKGVREEEITLLLVVLVSVDSDTERGEEEVGRDGDIEG